MSMSNSQDSSDDCIWSELYAHLRAYTRLLVRRANLQVWRGQEVDVVEDIVQETIVRVYLHTSRVEAGLGERIISLQSFSRWVAHNFCEDLRRKDIRLFHTLVENTIEVNDLTATRGNWSDPVQDALEKIALLAFFFELALIIKMFPLKQRTALLIDLANLADFGEQLGLLESALLEVDISLKDYVQPLPLDPRLRSQHASLLSIAYRRLKEEARGTSFVA